MTSNGAATGRTGPKAVRQKGDSGAHHAAGGTRHGTEHEAPTNSDRDPDETMDVDAIKQILDLVREHELTEFELEQAGVKLRVKKQGAAVPVAAPPVPVMLAPAAASAPAPQALTAAPAAVAVPAAAAPAEPLELSVITSPIVGTFYRSADPSSPPFVDVGQRVKKGQTLCIIEAMKLMNEIESEYEGEIVKVYVENGQPVQYGERLFAVKTT
jgi:acetyl-CoA carboxylase biotin carboxyl carrier protein